MPRTKKLAHKQTSKKPKDPTTSFRTFQTEADQDRYSKYTADRTLCTEKGFLLKTTPTMGYEEFITSVIIQHKWQTFCSHPIEAVVPVIREFYAHFAWEGQRSVYVRGVQVPIDETTINQFYGLDDVDDIHTEFATNTSPECLDRALANVCVAGTAWIVSPQGKMTIPRTSLTPQCKVWYHFLKTRLMPSTHVQTVSKDRVLLLDSIISGRSINVGATISKELGVCATKKCGSLWFPALITGLCMRNGVPIFDNDERLSLSKGVITNSAITRLIQGKLAEGPSDRPHNEDDEAAHAPEATTTRATAASSSRVSPHAELTKSLNMLEQRMSLAEVQQFQTMEMLQQMHSQQQQFWEYAKQRDVALKKSLQKNFTKPIFPFPEFPDGVLEPLAADEVDEEDADNQEA